MKQALLFVLLIGLPSLANAAFWQMPSGKVFEEKISYHRTLSGVLISVSEWIEIQGVIKKANAKDFSWRDEIENFTRAMAGIYGNNPIETLENNQCESQWNSPPDEKVQDYALRALTILGDKGKALGETQFWESTFNKWKKEASMPELKYHNWQDRLRLQAWAFSKGEKYKDDWTCYVMIFIKKTRPISANWE